MRKTLTVILLVIAAATQGYGQEVYNRLYESANQVLNDPEAPKSKTDVNHFYVTVLNYLKGTASTRMETVTTTFLDTQAYYLSEFVGSFFRNLSRAHQVSAECQHGVLMAYVNASINNPLFGDADTEKVQAFVGEAGCLTPFSLDTDWEKAYTKASQEVEELMKKP